MTRAFALALAAVVLTASASSGCSRRVPERGPDGTAVVDTVGPPDSLALRLADGGEVWLGEGRAAADPLGRRCRERTLLIIRGGRRTVVPLLYTGDAPELAGDSTVRARLWLNCKPGAWYRVDTRTAQPQREGG